MTIFLIGFDPELATLVQGDQFMERGNQLFSFGRFEDSDFTQHGNMGNGGLTVERDQFIIEHRIVACCKGFDPGVE
jgi:hypothetical protein